MPLTHAQQFDVEDQGCVGGNYASRAASSIAKLRWDSQLPLAPDLHPVNSFVPAFDHLAAPQVECKWLAVVDGTVELLAVGEPSCVVDFDCFAPRGDRSCADRDVPKLETIDGSSGLSSYFCWSAGVRFRGTALRKKCCCQESNDCNQAHALQHQLFLRVDFNSEWNLEF